MKVCSKCNIEKDESQFFKRDSGESTHSWCKQCNTENVRNRKRELKRLCVEYKGGVCVDCGGKFHPAIFDFHHVDQKEKDFSISSITSTKLTDPIKSELDKCVLLCANCHRLRHYQN